MCSISIFVAYYLRELWAALSISLNLSFPFYEMEALRKTLQSVIESKSGVISSIHMCCAYFMLHPLLWLSLAL